MKQSRKIDLIYIDPPFATGADFSVRIAIGDLELIKEPSAIEEKAYRDTWGKGLDSYLQMMYERLILMKELLSDKGSIYVHLDWRVNSYVRILMDDIFGNNNFQREIIWYFDNVSGFKSIANKWIRDHENILWYTKNEKFTFNKVYGDYPEGYEKKFSNIDEDGRKYMKRAGRRQYLDELKGKPLGDVWRIPFINNMALERVGYETQKPEALLERILLANSDEGDIVADFFCGSGTTGAVAEKLNRRWIMADIGRYAIHTTRKRMLEIENCKPFIVQNLGKYERQYWQGVTFNKRSKDQMPLYEYLKFILDLYHAESITGMVWIHGKKGKRLIHIGAVDAPVTLSDIESAVEECKKMKQNALDILGWEWEMGLHDVVQKFAKEKGVDLRLRYIPREVMDQRAVESGEITFYELSYLEAEVNQNKRGEFIIHLKDFIIPNHDLIPEEVQKKIKKWSDYIDYWAVDWDYNEDTFHNMWQAYRTRKDRTLPLKSDPYLYEKKGKHKILIKVIDIFGNDTTRLVEVKS